MANWKKVIVSGSSAQLSQISVDTDVNISGSLNVGTNQQIGQSSAKLSGSFSGSFEGQLQSVLPNSNQANIVSYDVATGLFSYQGTGSFTATTASYVASTGVDGPHGMNSILSASHADNADTLAGADPSSFATTGSNTFYGDQIVNGNIYVLGGGFTGSFTGSFTGDGAGLKNVPASGIVGLQLNQIGSGSVTASISPNLGFRVNTNSQITGSLIVSSDITSAGNVVATGANSSLTGSFSGSFTGVTNLPDLTEGSGITAFTYDGSTTATVAVSGASTLTVDTVTKWSGDAFVNSSITDNSNVTINNAGGVLIETGGLYVTGSSTFHDSLVVEGNFTVNGTASFQHSTNLAIADQFILLNSGSTTFQDSGFVISTGNAGNSGSAFFLETAGTTTGTDSLNGRFAVAGNVQPDATAVTAEEYAVTTMITGSAPTTNVPQFGGTTLGHGNMWVDSATGDIYIYA